MLRAALAVCCAATLSSLAIPASAQTTIVRTDGAILRDGGSDAATRIATLPALTPVGLWNGMSREWPTWLQVRAIVAGKATRGWVKADDLMMSEGWQRLNWRDYRTAISLLRAEATLASDPAIAGWLTFQLGFAHQGAGQLDQAGEVLEGLGGQRPASALTPFAYLAAARVHLARRDLAAVRRAYEALLEIAPSFQVPAEECEARAQVRETLCSGDPSIAARVAALSALADQQSASDRVIASSSATPTDKALAWFALGEAWERKNRIDPGFQETGVPNDDARRCYEAAVLAAPRSPVAGDAAWKLIAFSAPYEWEGDIAARSAWTMTKFGVFLRDYPDHSRAGDALYEMATATWASGGYPEAFHYLIAPRPMLGPRRQLLEQWFDTRGFGGGPGELAVPKPAQAARALAMFKEVAAKYPTSSAAPRAQYYAAVILDYGLNEKAAALQEFEAFVRKHPQLEPLASKARARIEALRR